MAKTKGVRMATVFEVNGTRREVHPATPPSFTLEEMHALVGGFIEMVPMAGDKMLIINEEGKLQGLLCNLEATLQVRDRLLPGDYIAGPAVLVSQQELGE